MSDGKQQIDDMTQLYKSKMLNELEKFLNVYNDVAGTVFVFDVRGQYDQFIRMLGKYIFSVYSPEGWQDTSLTVADEVVIDFSVFRGTRYEEPVANYLCSLRRAFDDSLDEQVESFLSTTDKYTEEEKVICREFFGKVTALHRGMKQATFGADTPVDTDLMSTDTISKYQEALREYNSYMTYVAKNRRLLTLIQHFDGTIRSLSAQKKQVEVLFDV